MFEGDDLLFLILGLCIIISPNLEANLVKGKALIEFFQTPAMKDATRHLIEATGAIFTIVGVVRLMKWVYKEPTDRYRSPMSQQEFHKEYKPSTTTLSKRLFLHNYSREYLNMPKHKKEMFINKYGENLSRVYVPRYVQPKVAIPFEIQQQAWFKHVTQIDRYNTRIYNTGVVAKWVYIVGSSAALGGLAYYNLPITPFNRFMETVRLIERVVPFSKPSSLNSNSE